MTELDSDIRTLAVDICNALAEAIEKYTAVSCEFHEYMPEHFAVAFILNKLGDGDKRCMTMETTARALWQWNLDAKRRQGKSIEAENPPPAFFDDCQKQACDMVVFRDGPFCLVEMKKGHVNEPDIAKINRWLRYIDMCQYGMVSSYCEVPKFQPYVREWAKKARTDRHSWVKGRIARPKAGGEERKFATFARYWSRTV